jgi:hypothetical protein
MRLVVLALFVASTGATLRAQDDPAQVVQAQAVESGRLAAAWLDSIDPRVRAWGAYLVLRDHQRQLIPRLVALVEAHPVHAGPLVGAERDAHDAMLGVLDAVIQFERTASTISPKTAAALYAEFPTPALILLSAPRSVDANAMSDSLLMDIFRQERTSTGAWLAAGNLLMNHRTPGLASTILANVTVGIDVRVLDDGSPRGRGIGVSCSFGSPGPVRSGWPEVGNYFISKRTGTLFASGRDPSYYVRSVSGADPNPQRAELPCDWWDRDSLTEHFLVALAGQSPETSSFRLKVARDITWASDPQYLAELQAVVNEEQRRIDELGSALARAGQLDGNDWMALRPSVGVRISDDRRRPPGNLPPPQDLGAGVAIKIQ